VLAPRRPQVPPRRSKPVEVDVDDPLRAITMLETVQDVIGSTKNAVRKKATDTSEELIRDAALPVPQPQRPQRASIAEARH
jgi:hypothetical protein